MSIQGRGTVSVSIVTAVLVFLAASTTFVISAAQAQTFSVLHTFTGGSDGGGPYGGLTEDAAGNFYGTATFGGIDENGVVFKLTRAGSGWLLSTLYEFRGGSDGAEPDAGVSIGPDGALYGATHLGGGGAGCAGGCGTVYRLVPPATVCKSVSCPWTETVLHRFGVVNGDGTLPAYGNPVFDRAGNLYGTTQYGGTADLGTVYELTPSSGGWTENILWNFNGYSGKLPSNSLIFDAAGNLYGTTELGGYNGGGSAFELSPSGSLWTLTTLFSFNGTSTGEAAVGGLAWDSQGNLYGTTQGGGEYDYGTAYQLAPSGGGWNYTQMQYFLCCGGPQSTPAVDSAGNVYISDPAAGGEGAIFELTQMQGTWTSTILHQFEFSDGSSPNAGVTLAPNGNVYGTTSQGGSDNQGVIYEITP